MKFFLCVAGTVMIIEGFPYFAFPDKMKAWILKVQEISSNTLQKFGFALIMMGFVFLYLGIR